MNSTTKKAMRYIDLPLEGYELADLGNLDLIDMVIFGVIKYRSNAEFMDTLKCSGKTYFKITWEEINFYSRNFLKIDTRHGMYKRLDKICEAGLIEFGTVNQKKSYSFLRILDKQYDVYGSQI